MSALESAKQNDNQQPYLSVRRLIEVDLPIKRISAHARREKSIRHGHISTLHIWWARRPLAACRAVICAALWPDPSDELCPQSFRDSAAQLMQDFAFTAVEKRSVADLCHPVMWGKLAALRQPDGQLDTDNADHLNFLRFLLLDFIADFSSWYATTEPHFLATARALTQAAHESLGGLSGTRPLVVDPFAGGGAIPLEALRVGADAFASDLNPVAVLLNKVVLDYIPKYGQKLAYELRNWGKWVQKEAKDELTEFYPTDSDGQTPVAYLWARTISCEGPGCGAEIPLIRSLWLSRKKSGAVALQMISNPQAKRVDFEIKENARAKDVSKGTIRRGSATCPVCNYTTPVSRVRHQLSQVEGGTDTSRLIAVVRRSETGKSYRLPQEGDLAPIHRSLATVDRSTILPITELPLMSGVFNVPIYGITRWDLLFSARQLKSAQVLGEKIGKAAELIGDSTSDSEYALALKVLLFLALDKYLDFRTSLCGWISVGEKIGHTFGRQALGMIFDWTEGTPFGDMSGSWSRCVDYIAKVLEREASSDLATGTIEQAVAQVSPLPDDVAQAFITDPPYYNAVPYADLSDFFYLWLRQGLQYDFPSLLAPDVAPKSEELCEMSGWDSVRYPHKDAAFYEEGMIEALSEGRRVSAPTGIGVVVFAHKTTAGWESFLSAMIDSGWMITGSWPIDTERGARLRAMGSAALASSIHLVCRPRENPDGSLRTHDVGNWRDVLDELPARIHEWMPRLAQEGVVGADAIFACLGPALEIYSRYSRVERADGSAVPLGDVLGENGQVTERGYLSHVWEAVSREALIMIFEGADTAGFEADARLTAMWLWTLSTTPDSPEPSADENAIKSIGYTLEFDAARKIAQGLGAHLERMRTLVEIKGNKARLLPVSERAEALFGTEGPTPPRRRVSTGQLSLFAEMDVAKEEGGFGDLATPPAGATVLDRVHQAMLLFAAGQSEELRRFLVEDGVGRDTLFWRLAQALSALYPPRTDEKRWVDGVLARKKGLGF